MKKYILFIFMMLSPFWLFLFLDCTSPVQFFGSKGGHGEGKEIPGRVTDMQIFDAIRPKIIHVNPAFNKSDIEQIDLFVKSLNADMTLRQLFMKGFDLMQNKKLSVYAKAFVTNIITLCTLLNIGLDKKIGNRRFRAITTNITEIADLIAKNTSPTTLTKKIFLQDIFADRMMRLMFIRD